MQARETVAVIGATGTMGTAIAKSLSGGHYRLLLFSNNNVGAQSLAEEIRHAREGADVEAVDCSYDACWEADIIIAAVPHAAEKELADKIREVVNQKIVISISNPLNEARDVPTAPPGISAAEALQELLPHAKVVKAFNTTFAATFSRPRIGDHRTDAFIAGNDSDALQTVQELVLTAGFNPLIAGDLSASRTLESMQLLLFRLGARYGYNRLAGWKILHR